MTYGASARQPMTCKEASDKALKILKDEFLAHGFLGCNNVIGLTTNVINEPSMMAILAKIPNVLRKFIDLASPRIVSTVT